MFKGKGSLRNGLNYRPVSLVVIWRLFMFMSNVLKVNKRI